MSFKSKLSTWHVTFFDCDKRMESIFLLQKVVVSASQMTNDTFFGHFYDWCDILFFRHYVCLDLSALKFEMNYTELLIINEALILL